jgi:hypothetical protein
MAAGGSAKLCWRTLNAAAVRIEPDLGAVKPEGQTEVRPAETTTYTLTAEGKGPAQTNTVKVFVHAFHQPVTLNGAKPGLAAAFYEHTDWRLRDFGDLEAVRRATVAKLAFAKVAPKKKSPLKPPKPGPDGDRGEDTSLIAADKKETTPVPGFAGSGRDDKVAGVLTGYIKAPADGLYQFTVSSGEEATVSVAGKTVAKLKSNGRKFRHRTSNTGRIALKAGWYPLVVRLCHSESKFDFAVRWRRPDGKYGPVSGPESIPPEMLCH